jgi:hypothetical protein
MIRAGILLDISGGPVIWLASLWFLPWTIEISHAASQRGNGGGHVPVD